MSNDTRRFRGRTMPEVVARLKETLGPDAVIVNTRRGRDEHGSFVEVTAHAAIDAAPVVETTPGVEPPAQGGRVGASAAYARNANGRGAPANRGRASRTVDRIDPRVLAAVQGKQPGPFAERAAMLAGQIARRVREDEEATTAYSGPDPSPFEERYAEVDALPPPRTAAETPAERVARTDATQLARLEDELTALRGQLSRLEQPQSQAQGVTEAHIERMTGTLATHLAEIRGLLGAGGAVTDARRGSNEAPLARELRDRLIDGGVSAAHAAELAGRVERCMPDRTAEDADLLALLGKQIADDLYCTGDLIPEDGRRRVLGFVGPTGVGKTTTIAKVAAHAQLLRGVKTALVTVDTFRMAAIDQLARYAEILECPLRIAKSPEELTAALDELADYDLVLVDSTGRNPRAADQVNALARFFPEGWGGELVLTVAASTRETDLFATVDAFAGIGPAQICVTKMDETDAHGVVYSLVRRAGRPVCWITNGQRVPEDIEVADAAVLAARVAARTAHAGRRSAVALAG